MTTYNYAKSLIAEIKELKSLKPLTRSSFSSQKNPNFSQIGKASPAHQRPRFGSTDYRENLKLMKSSSSPRGAITH